MKSRMGHFYQVTLIQKIMRICSFCRLEFLRFLRLSARPLLPPTGGLRPLRFALRPLRETILIILAAAASVQSQEVKNIRVSQVVNRVNVVYDLEGQNKYYMVLLYYTADDGKTWNGPLKNVNGDIGEKQKPGLNKTIVWDALAEKGPIEGMMQFKVVAELSRQDLQAELRKKEKTEEKIPVIKPWKSDEAFKKARSVKTGLLTSALVTAGIGTFSLLQGNRLYDDYLTAGENATDLHNKVTTYDTITPIAFGLAGGCTVAFIIKASKQGKIKKQLSLQPVSFEYGGGMKLAFKF